MHALVACGNWMSQATALFAAPRGDVAIVSLHYAAGNGLDACLTSARQRATWEQAFPTRLPGQERHRADLRLHAWEQDRGFCTYIVGQSKLTAKNLQYLVLGGAAMCALRDKPNRSAVLPAGALTIARARGL
eukprot:jgi/Botrbrau1/8178/Bobra.357_2s0023.1